MNEDFGGDIITIPDEDGNEFDLKAQGWNPLKK